MLSRIQRGFTAAEFLVVIAVVAIGATLAAPGATQMIANRKVQGAAESILDGLNDARAEAVRRNTPVRFTLAADGWTIAVVSSGATVQSFRTGDWGGLSISSTAASAVTFLPTGLLQAGTQLSQVSVASAAADSRTRRINVFGGGLIRMCDPGITAADDPRRC